MAIRDGINWALSVTRINTKYDQNNRCKNELNGYNGDPQNYDCTSFCAAFAVKAGLQPVYMCNGNNTWYTGDADFWLKKWGWQSINIDSVPVQQGDIIIRNNGNDQDHGEVVYLNPSGSPAKSDNYRTIGTGGRYPHSVIEQQSNFGSNPCTAAYRHPSGGATVSGYGWSFNAFCALLGNIEQESNFNPGGIEAPYTFESPKKGLGLFQWTEERAGVENPIVKLARTYNKNWYDGTFQCEVINNADSRDYDSPETWGWIYAGYQPRNFQDFKISNLDIPTLTETWLKNVERASAEELNNRVQAALRWADFLADHTPEDGAGRSWAYEITNVEGVLTRDQRENNVLLMYNIFCGSGIPGAGLQQPDWWYYQRRSAWNVIYACKPFLKRL